MAASRALAALALAVGLPAAAEELATVPVAGAPAEAPAPEPANELPDMVVTSNKKQQVLRDIPASIAAIDGGALESSGAQGMEDFVNKIPGVNLIPNEPGAFKVTVRGISSDLGTNATTGILFGNVSFNDAYFPFVSLDPNPFDLYDVEVLKGPQGTLYGASALNGAVRYVPNAPVYDTWELKYFAEYASVHEGGRAPTYGAAANLPLGSGGNAAVRLAAHKRESAGYVDDTGRGLQDVNELDQSGLRGLFAWQPWGGATVSAMVMRQDTHFRDDSFTDNTDGRLSRNDTPAANPKHSAYDLANAAIQQDFELASVTLEGALVTKEFTEQPDISRLATGQASSSTVSSTIFFNSDTKTLELRAATPTGATSPWSWVTGAFWSDQPIDSGYDIFTTGTGAILGHQRSAVTVTEKALFADVTRALGKKWEASLGVRGYRTRSGGTARASGALYGGSENVNQGDVDEKGVNPKASVRWLAGAHVQVYALASRGFRVGGIQPTASALSTSIPKSFKSDTLRNYEAGARTQWLDDSLRADLTVFHEDWDKPQLAQRDPNNPNPVATYYDNVGGAKSDGVELAAQWRTPLDGLSASVSGAYAKTVTTVPFTTASGVNTTPGTTWPYAPKWQTAAALSYDRPLWGAWQLHGTVSQVFLSRAYTTLAHDIEVFGYHQYDALLRVGPITGPWPDISVGVTNLLDRRGINQHTLTGPANDVTYMRPRTVMLRLDGHF